MNSLIVYPEEGWSGRRVTLVGERARAAREAADCDVGAELRLVVFGGEKGIGKVVECSEERVVFEIIRTELSLNLRPIDLIVGLSRPQTTKKVIQAAVMAGVRSLHLVHLASGQKSYLDAHLLCEDSLRAEIAKALEQIWEGRYPTIQVHRSFDRFVLGQSALMGPSDALMRIVAHPGAAPLDFSVCAASGAAVIAVGSEGGWSQDELTALLANGFSQVGLGQRVVRVEVALLYLLGQTLSIGS